METQQQPPFLARSAEIESLRVIVAEAKQGKGRVLFLEGEPGIGKTRIMRELGRRVEKEGMLVLIGRCYGKTVPYSAWIEMAYEYSHLVNKEKLTKITSGLPPEFTSIVLPTERIPSPDAELGIRAWLKGPSGTATESRPRPEVTQGVDRIRLFEGFLRFFTNISQGKPLILLVDDLQLADSATVQLLRYFAGKVVLRRVAIIGSYRDDQLKDSEILSETIEDLKREGLCRIIRIEPLNLDETRELIETVIGSSVSEQSLVQRIFRVSQGNPFFVQELASTLASRMTTSHQASTGLPWMSSSSAPLELPTSIRAIIKRKLVRLPPETVQVLSAASIIGQEFDFELVRDVTQLGEDSILQHLEACVREGVVSEVTGAKQVLYRFNHPLIRDVLAEELGTPRRRRYHRSIAEAIERLKGSEPDRFLDILALHYLESGDEKRAVELSLRAAARAEKMLAYDEAIHHLSNAFELCEIPELRRRIDEDIAGLKFKEEGWRKFLQEEAVKVGIAGYDKIGENYARVVVPIFEPIAKPIVEWAEPKAGQRVLDAGTGTGLLALSIAPAVGPSGHVLGVDISQGMLAVARRKVTQMGLKNIEFRLMDDTSLAIPDSQFDLSVASFGLPPFNADKAISEIYRVTKSPGVFVFDEWEAGVESKPGMIFEETLSRYKTTSPSEKLVTIRESASYRGRGFKKLYDKATLLDWLKKAGFSRVETFKRSHEIRSTSFEDYFEYQVAWWTVDAELQEMSEEARGDFVKALKDALTPLMDSYGLLEKVEVNYFKAYKP